MLCKFCSEIAASHVTLSFKQIGSMTKESAHLTTGTFANNNGHICLFRLYVLHQDMKTVNIIRIGTEIQTLVVNCYY
jgi:hypothetical protein